jgi:hypothetical protein
MERGDLRVIGGGGQPGQEERWLLLRPAAWLWKASRSPKAAHSFDRDMGNPEIPGTEAAAAIGVLTGCCGGGCTTRESIGRQHVSEDSHVLDPFPRETAETPTPDEGGISAHARCASPRCRETAKPGHRYCDFHEQLFARVRSEIATTFRQAVRRAVDRDVRRAAGARP